MMRGIKLRHGTAFVEHEGVTVRIRADGKCELSPILFRSLEWDLRTEPQDSWEYLSDSDIDGYGADTRKQIESIVAKVHRVIEA